MSSLDAQKFSISFIKFLCAYIWPKMHKNCWYKQNMYVHIWCWLFNIRWTMQQKFSCILYCILERFPFVLNRPAVVFVDLQNAEMNSINVANNPLRFCPAHDKKGNFGFFIFSVQRWYYFLYPSPSNKYI